MDSAELETVVRTIIAAGESYYAEYKTAWDYGPDGRAPRDIKEVARDIGEAVVAFANSDGGDLLVGVEDSGSITGIPWTDDRVLYLQQAPRQQVKASDVGVQVYEVVIDGHRILWFRVQEHAEGAVVTSGGRCLWRKGATSEPVPPVELERRREHRLGDTAYEAQPMPTARVEDLELPWPEIQQRPHLKRFADTGDAAGLLRYWNLVEGRNGSTVLRRAALLLFAVDPLRWHPNNRVRLRRVPGGVEGFGRTLGTREQDILGPVALLARSAVRALHRGLTVDSRQESLFTTDQLLPFEAVEECVVNALLHRNYAIEGNAVEVVFYPDRLEFRSPGRLPEPLTIEDLQLRRGAHRARNPLLMRVMRDLGWARDQGEGMKRIYGAMSQVELHEPELEVVADTFVVRLSTRSLYDEQTRAWISAYGPFGLQPDERRFIVGLRAEGGTLSVDRLARVLSESYDKTKVYLERLEGKGLVWHAYKSRSYHMVEPLLVGQERAYRLFETAGIALEAATVLGRTELERLARQPDDRSFEAWVDRLKESGILTPAGKGRWKLGQSLLEYARTRAE